MKKILVIDDVPDFRDLCLLILRIFTNVEVLEAVDGVEGLEKMMKENPDVTIIDLCMPRMDGVQMIREAKKRGFNKKTILVTASCMQHELKDIEKEFDSVINKPLDIKDLQNKVSRYLNQ